MELAMHGIKRWVEPALCIGYIRRVDGRLASVYEGVALFTDDVTRRAWTIQQPPGRYGYEMSLDVYLDCPQIDIWNTSHLAGAMTINEARVQKGIPPEQE